MKKVVYYGTGTLLLLVGAGAVTTGAGLMLEPSGENLSMSVKLLDDSPFTDFFFPGMALAVLIGLGSLAGSALAFIRHSFTAAATILIGAMLTIWIGAQVYWIGWESWLQPAFLAIGVIEMLLGFAIYEQSHHTFNDFFHRRHSGGKHAH